MREHNILYIRTDANPHIASGHVMRCLAIAGELRRKNVDVTFLTADSFAGERIRSQGYSHICLGSEWKHLEPELPKLERLIRGTDNSCILVDSYSATDAYLESLCRWAKVIYLDDMGQITCPVDMLINYNIYAEDMDYHALRGNNRTKLLLGTAYAPLREEFQTVQPVYRDTVQRILITTGGTDPYNAAGRILQEIQERQVLQDMEWYVIAGNMNRHLAQLRSLAETSKRVHVLSDVKNMSKIMQNCDISVSACGSTMYELCACAVPAVTFTFADNQLPGAAGFHKKSVACNCGDIRDDIDGVIQRIVTELVELSENGKRRKRFYEQASKLVDGCGVKRIADEIQKLMSDVRQ